MFKPVHIICVQGRILKRAFSKLKLEHVVIGKGQFHQERMKSNAMVDVEVRYVFLVPLFLLVISGDVVQ